MRSPALRVALIGWGAIGRAAAAQLSRDEIDVVAVATTGKTTPADLPPGAKHITDPGELAGTQPDVVAEAAGVEAVQPWGEAALGAEADFVVSSVAAFADANVLEGLTQLAERHGAAIQVQPGALAGVDALAAARPMGIDTVQHRIVKPPAAWQGTDAERLCDLTNLQQPETFFAGSAAEVAAAFPKNANVAMTTALAGIGPDRTQVSLVADPTAQGNSHHIEAAGAFGHLQVSVTNAPLPDNPKSSAMAALALARALGNRASLLAI